MFRPNLSSWPTSSTRKRAASTKVTFSNVRPSPDYQIARKVFRQVISESDRGLRDHDRKFGKHLKLFGVERVDSLHAIGLHGRDDLQVKYISARDRMTL